MKYPRKTVAYCGKAASVRAGEFPRPFADWLASRPRKEAEDLDVYLVSGEWYARSAGPGDGLTLLRPWEQYLNIQTDKPFVSVEGAYLFKVAVVDLSGDGTLFGVMADSPEDGKRYFIEVLSAPRETSNGTGEPAG